MTDDEKWKRLQELAAKTAKEDLLTHLLDATGLDTYIADAIAEAIAVVRQEISHE